MRIAWREIFQLKLDPLLIWVSLVFAWFLCRDDCCPVFIVYNVCLSPFTLQLTWVSSIIVWREQSQQKLDSLLNCVSLVLSVAFSDDCIISMNSNDCHFPHSVARLDLYINYLTGEFTCPTFIDECRISCNPDIENITEACRALWDSMMYSCCIVVYTFLYVNGLKFRNALYSRTFW